MKHGLVKEKLEVEISIWIYPVFDSKLPNIFKCWLTLFIYLFIFFFFFFLLRAVPEAYGGSQARGPIGATAASLHHSHGNAGSELCLQPTPQLMEMPDP